MQRSILQIVEKNKTKSKKNLQKVLTSTKSRVILISSNDREVKTMSQKKGNKKDKHDIATIALVTAIISLIGQIVDLINKLAN